MHDKNSVSDFEQGMKREGFISRYEVLVGSAKLPDSCSNAIYSDPVRHTESILRTVREEEMEPPAAYWESLRGDIQRRVSTPVSSVRPSWRPAWAMVVASAAVVVAVLALTGAPRGANSVQRADVRVWTALPSADDDASLDLVQAAVDELDEVSTDELGVSPALVAALEDMNDDEALSLARAMIEDGTEKGRL